MSAPRIRRRYRASNWMLLAEVASCIVVAAVAKRGLPFRVASRILGETVERPTTPSLPLELHVDLAWAFHFLRRAFLPRALCLTEVMALSLLLRRRGLRGSAVLGVSSIAPFQAHAWMRCGDGILPRAQDVEPYRVIAVFEPPTESHAE